MSRQQRRWARSVKISRLFACLSACRGALSVLFVSALIVLAQSSCCTGQHDSIGAAACTAQTSAKAQVVRQWLSRVHWAFVDGGGSIKSRFNWHAWSAEGRSIENVTQLIAAEIRERFDDSNSLPLRVCCFALGEVGTKLDASILVTCAKHRYGTVRTEAVLALAKLGAVDQLDIIGTLARSDPDINVRANACKALFELNDTRADEMVRAIATAEKHPFVKSVAGEIVESIDAVRQGDNK